MVLYGLIEDDTPMIMFGFTIIGGEPLARARTETSA